MAIQETGQGLIVTVKVRPNSARIGFLKQGEDIVLEVTSPPRGGKANQEILSELPKMLRCEVTILRGSRARKKMLLLKGISQVEFEAVLDTRQPGQDPGSQKGSNVGGNPELK